MGSFLKNGLEPSEIIVAHYDLRGNGESRNMMPLSNEAVAAHEV